MKLPRLDPGERLLIYGIGNPGRQDDALGVRLVERLATMGLTGNVTLDANYQLAPEDALLFSEHDVALVADATVATEAPAPYDVHPVEPRATTAFTSHALGIGTVLELAARLYGRTPRTFALAMPAYAFDVNADLSPLAARNLARTVDAVVAMLVDRSLDAAGRD